MDNENAIQTPAPSAPPVFGAERERERVHRQILSSVSHDLKTPLASIIGSLEVYERMKAQLNEERQQTLIRVALQEAYRLDAFITNILDMAKLESGVVKVQREPTEIGSVIKNCMMRLSLRLQGSTVNLTAKSGTLEIFTDPVLFNRAMSLVIDNAVKYGGVTPTIDIDYEADDMRHAIITVRDKGLGIPETQLDTIFCKYTRLAKQDQQGPGTGLGLAICREIMTLLGGTVIAGNHPEGGALVTLTLPVG